MNPENYYKNTDMMDRYHHFYHQSEVNYVWVSLYHAEWKYAVESAM